MTQIYIRDIPKGELSRAPCNGRQVLVHDTQKLRVTTPTTLRDEVLSSATLTQFDYKNKVEDELVSARLSDIDLMCGDPDEVLTLSIQKIGTEAFTNYSRPGKRGLFRSLVGALFFCKKEDLPPSTNFHLMDISRFMLWHDLCVALGYPEEAKTFDTHFEKIRYEDKPGPKAEAVKAMAIALEKWQAAGLPICAGSGYSVGELRRRVSMLMDVGDIYQHGNKDLLTVLAKLPPENETIFPGCYDD